MFINDKVKYERVAIPLGDDGNPISPTEFLEQQTEESLRDMLHICTILALGIIDELETRGIVLP